MTMLETTRLVKSTSNIKFQVFIKDPQEVLKSGDKIEGKVKMKNTNEKKPQKVKSVSFVFWEHVNVPEGDNSKIDWKGDNFGGKTLSGRRAGYSKIKVKDKLEPNEEKEVDFSIKVPGGLHTNMGGKDPSNDWFLGLTIGVRSKMVPSVQYNRILPIENSDRSADWLD